MSEEKTLTAGYIADQITEDDIAMLYEAIDGSNVVKEVVDKNFLLGFMSGLFYGSVPEGENTYGISVERYIVNSYCGLMDTCSKDAAKAYLKLKISEDKNVIAIDAKDIKDIDGLSKEIAKAISGVMGDGNE